jgi:hypothetical protein
VLLKITQADIDLAKGRYSIWHPVYLAIYRQTGQSWAYHDGFVYPIVGPPVAVDWRLKKWCYNYLLRQPVEPEEFEVDLPTQEGCGKKRVLKEELFK